MEQSGQTLHDFVLNLFSDSQALTSFEQDPAAVLDNAGLSGISAADVQEVMPLVIDYAPVHGAALDSALSAIPTDSVASGQLGAIQQLQYVTQAFTGLQYASVSDAAGSQASTTYFSNPTLGIAGYDSSASGPEIGYAHSDALSSALGDGLLSSTVTPDGEFDAQGQFTSSELHAGGEGALRASADGGLAADLQMHSPLGATTIATEIPGLSGGAPSLPGVGSLPGLPGIGSLPGLPGVGSLPGLPGVGSLPGLPGIGSLPGLPGVGSLPGLGGLPSGFSSASDVTDALDGHADSMSSQLATNMTTAATVASGIADMAAGAMADPETPLAAAMADPAAAVTNLTGTAEAYTAYGTSTMPAPLNSVGAEAVHTVNSTVDNGVVGQVTSHLPAGGVGDLTSGHLPTPDLGTAGSTVTNVVGQVTSHLPGAGSIGTGGLGDLTSHLDPSQATQTVQSVTSTVQSTVGETASHSPVGDVMGNAGTGSPLGMVDHGGLGDLSHTVTDLHVPGL